MKGESVVLHNRTLKSIPRERKLSPLARKLKVVSSLVLHEIDDLMTVPCFFMAGEVDATKNPRI